MVLLAALLEEVAAVAVALMLGLVVLEEVLETLVVVEVEQQMLEEDLLDLAEEHLLSLLLDLLFHIQITEPFMVGQLMKIQNKYENSI
jgi:hypothetical protein